MLRHHGRHHPAVGQAIGKACSQQHGLAIEAGDRFIDAFGLPGRTGGEQGYVRVVAQRGQGKRVEAHGHRRVHDLLWPMPVQRPVAEDTVEKCTLFIQQRHAVMPWYHRRFSRVQRGQQRHDKQIAVFKAQRPAFTFQPLQVGHQPRDIRPQVAERPGVVVLPGNRSMRRT